MIKSDAACDFAASGKQRVVWPPTSTLALRTLEGVYYKGKRQCKMLSKLERTQRELKVADKTFWDRMKQEHFSCDSECCSLPGSRHSSLTVQQCLGMELVFSSKDNMKAKCNYVILTI
ncbi:uncharacterized protein V6R79_019855 [Siganus canaliculatus]